MRSANRQIAGNCGHDDSLESVCPVPRRSLYRLGKTKPSNRLTLFIVGKLAKSRKDLVLQAVHRSSPHQGPVEFTPWFNLLIETSGLHGGCGETISASRQQPEGGTLSTACTLRGLRSCVQNSNVSFRVMGEPWSTRKTTTASRRMNPRGN
jgi:hypothetical protein